MPQCFYEVLGVAQTATPEELKTAYRRLALQWHPDKNQARIEEATSRFKDIQNAYEILSDKNERAWYDAHRDSIVRSSDGYYGADSSTGEKAERPDDINIWSFFSASAFFGYGNTAKGFYGVYGDLFQKIYKQEQQYAARENKEIPAAPPFGQQDSPYSVVAAFYSHWTNFVTIKDFAWCDEYNLAAAPSRKVRRLMEEENKKIRKRERKEFNDVVRQLALFVKKRDKRVLERQVELQRLQKEKEAEQKRRKEEAVREKARRAASYVEPEWAQGASAEGRGRKGAGEEGPHELYCIVCRKRFKSEKQWKNHEKSKKHLENVAHLKEALVQEEEGTGEGEGDWDRVEDGKGEAGEGWREEEGGESAEMGPGNRTEAQESREEAYDRGGWGQPEGFPCRGWKEQKREESDGEGSASVREEEEEEDGVLDEEEDEAVLARMLRAHREQQRGTEQRGRSREGSSQGAPDEAGVGSSGEGREDEADGGSSQAEEPRGQAHASGTGGGGGDDAADSCEVGDEAGGGELQGASDGELRPDSGSGNQADNGSGGVSGRATTGVAKPNGPQALPDGHHLQGEGVSREDSRTRGDRRGEEAGAAAEPPQKKGPPNKSAARRLAKQEKRAAAQASRHDAVLLELGADGEASVSPHQEPEARESGHPASGGSGRESGRGKNGRRVLVAGAESKAIAQQQQQQQQQQEEEEEGERQRQRGSRRGGKGKKGKAHSAEHLCDVCGEDFDSRNQLSKHISVTGHAIVKR